MLVQDARSFLFFLSNRGSRGPVLWWEGKSNSRAYSCSHRTVLSRPVSSHTCAP